MYVSEPLKWVFGTIPSAVPGVAQTSKCLVLLLTHFFSTEVPLGRFKLGFLHIEGIFFSMYICITTPPLVSPSSSKKRRHEYADSLHMQSL